MEVPLVVRKFYSHFPLYTYDDTPSPSTSKPRHPTLWIHPPTSASSYLSSDIECLKWQTYLVLREIPNIQLRWDIQPDGGVNGVLPSLHLPDSDLLGTDRIPSWADRVLGDNGGELEGYTSAELRDESRAWVSLFEGVIHSALLVSQSQTPVYSLISLLDPSSSKSPPLVSFFQPPLAPLTGISSLVPPSGTNVPIDATYERYRESVQAASDRLGNETWFLGSSQPTPLDAIMFAYLHLALASPDKNIRNPISTKQNLVLWERKVFNIVQKGYASSVES